MREIAVEPPKERPILFSAPMVRALLAGMKTQTRRVVRLDPIPQQADFTGWHPYRGRPAAMFHWSVDKVTSGAGGLCCPYGDAGDRLWVRESHWFFKDEHDPVTGYFPPKPDVSDVIFRADGEVSGRVWRPSIHMPRWASRILLEVTDVRVQRLQEISEEDAEAEGCAADIPRTWWQGYKDCGEHMGLVHQQVEADAPPDWMVEPHRMAPTPWLDRSARDHYRILWESITGAGSWDGNPWVWAVSFRRLKP